MIDEYISALLCGCVVAGEVKVDDDWPSAGQIVFNIVCL